MDDNSIIGDVLGQLGQTAKQAVKEVVKLPGESTEEKLKEENKAVVNNKQWSSDEERIKFLKDLYGSSQSSPEAMAGKAEPNSDQAKKASSPAHKPATEFEKQISDKSPDEQRKLLELRNQLHKQVYYDPTFNPVKNPPAGGEERPAEKIEKEKKMEALDLEEKEKKKPPPLAVMREQNKTEMFRGAAG